MILFNPCSLRGRGRNGPHAADNVTERLSNFCKLMQLIPPESKHLHQEAALPSLRSFLREAPTQVKCIMIGIQRWGITEEGRGSLY